MKTACKVLGHCLVFALAFACGASMAQSYPNKPIKLIVAYAPGGGTDIMARMIGQKLTEQLGHAVIVENKAGADGSIGVVYAAKAAPDGYTLLLGTSAELVFNSGLYSRLPYDPVRDFIPIIHLSNSPIIFAVGSAFPAANMKELVALARAKPEGLFYSSGATPFRVGVELFNKQAGTKIVHVPYKGAGPAVTAAVVGEVAFVTTSVAPAMTQLRAGKLRALAVTSLKRTVFLPDVPTVQESGLDFETSEGVPSWTGLFAPTGTPEAIIERLYNEASSALRTESVKERFTTLGFEIVGNSAAELKAKHRAEIAKWVKVTRDLNLRAD